MNKFLKILFFNIIFLGYSLIALAEGVEVKPDIKLPIDQPVLEKNTQILLSNDQKRLECNIGIDVMNRLTVSNDRIVNLFGDDGTFVTQTDDNTGQVFIKPTPENQQNPLSITIITENGLTQDLTLYPIQTKATTIILKPNYTNKNTPAETLLPGFNSTAITTQEQFIKLLRKAVLGELTEYKGKYSVAKRKIANLKIKHKLRYQAGACWVDVFTIENISQNTQTLIEKNFYHARDLAITINKQQLEPASNALMYVLVEY